MQNERQVKIEASETRVYSGQILSRSPSGNWVLSLPPLLRPHQQELEKMLLDVFSGKRSSPDNLALAQQLSLNWCASKAKMYGLSLDEH